MGARYYSPDLERFMAMDSYDLINRYNYANGNPIMFIDPSGHSWKSIFNYILNGAAIAGGVAASALSGGAAAPIVAGIFGIASGAAGMAAQRLKDTGHRGNGSEGLNIASAVLGVAGGAMDILGLAKVGVSQLELDTGRIAKQMKGFDPQGPADKLGEIYGDMPDETKLQGFIDQHLAENAGHVQTALNHRETEFRHWNYEGTDDDGLHLRWNVNGDEILTSNRVASNGELRGQNAVKYIRENPGRTLDNTILRKPVGSAMDYWATHYSREHMRIKHGVDMLNVTHTPRRVLDGFRNYMGINGNRIGNMIGDLMV